MQCADNGNGLLWRVLARDENSSQTGMGRERAHLVRPAPHNPSNLWISRDMPQWSWPPRQPHEAGLPQRIKVASPAWRAPLISASELSSEAGYNRIAPNRTIRERTTRRRLHVMSSPIPIVISRTVPFQRFHNSCHRRRYYLSPCFVPLRISSSTRCHPYTRSSKYTSLSR
jgi:hypothetical protein